jgi:hypothetical protein
VRKRWPALAPNSDGAIFTNAIVTRQSAVQEPYHVPLIHRPGPQVFNAILTAFGAIIIKAKNPNTMIPRRAQIGTKPRRSIADARTQHKSLTIPSAYLDYATQFSIYTIRSPVDLVRAISMTSPARGNATKQNPCHNHSLNTIIMVPM